MLDEYQKTLEIFKTEKNILKQRLNLERNDPYKLNEIINQICTIDSKIKEYNTKIENEKQKLSTIENNAKFFKNDKTEIDNKELPAKKRNRNKNQFSEIKENTEIQLEVSVIKEILKNDGKITITILNKENNIETHYTYKYKSKNYYFYQCNKRPSCKGKGKFNLLNNKFYITTSCKDTGIHNKLSFMKFCSLIDNNKIQLIDFKIKKNQSNLITYIFKHCTDINQINIKEEFNKYTNAKLLLNIKEISRIKTQILGKLKDITLIECIEKIKAKNLDIEIMSQDIKYSTINKSNNKIIERKQQIIIFGIKDRLNLMKNKNFYEYFIDITFRIVPKCYRPYKLMSISTLDNINKKTILIGFVFFIFMDAISYQKIFQYLNENYEFNPIIVHSDYEKSISIALKNSKFFKNDIIHIKCFFHFIKSIREHLKKYTKNKRYLTKINYEILKNIEIICFIEEGKIEGYKRFLIEKLYTLKISNKFINYLKDYWFTKDYNEYNYSKFINLYKNNNIALEKFYVTNNIIESLHSKLNYYSSKSKSNKYNFISCMEKIFNNDFVKHDNYKRYDYITRSLILLISKEFNNEKYKWIKYDTFKYYLKMVLNENNIPDNIDNYIILIEIESENYKNNNDIDNNHFIDNFESNNVKYN